MRSFGRPLALAALAAAVASCGSTSTSKFSKVVPQSVQRAIMTRFPSFAYVPARRPGFPFGSHFTRFFSDRPNEFGLEFSGPQGPQEVSFLVGKVPRCRKGGGMHTFRVNGVRIRWQATYEDQEAWRCLSRGHVSVWIAAFRSVSGDAALNTPQQRIDAILLVRMVADVKYIGYPVG